MNSAVETLSPTRVRLTIDVPFDEIRPSLDAAYQRIGQSITVPGFRKGKVPAAVIEVGDDTVPTAIVGDPIGFVTVQR